MKIVWDYQPYLPTYIISIKQSFHLCFKIDATLTHLFLHFHYKHFSCSPCGGSSRASIINKLHLNELYAIESNCLEQSIVYRVFQISEKWTQGQSVISAMGMSGRSCTINLLLQIEPSVCMISLRLFD